MPGKRTRRPGTEETSLYAPVKRYLEELGFTVKGEVCGCDLVALRGNEPPIVVIGELKLAFSLELVLQASIARLPAMRSGLPCASPGGADGCAIRAFISSAGCSALDCSGCYRQALSRCWLNPSHGVPAAIYDGAPGLFANTEPARAIRHSADRQDRQS